MGEKYFRGVDLKQIEQWGREASACISGVFAYNSEGSIEVSNRWKAACDFGINQHARAEAADSRVVELERELDEKHARCVRLADEKRAFAAAIDRVRRHTDEEIAGLRVSLENLETFPESQEVRMEIKVHEQYIALLPGPDSDKARCVGCGAEHADRCTCNPFAEPGKPEGFRPRTPPSEETVIPVKDGGEDE
jgi:hypothetical protein